MSPELKMHLIDFVKGCLGAMATAAVLALFQYIGAHIPSTATAVSMVVGGTFGVKAKM